MNPKGPAIFLGMQLFFVVFGFALFFGLKGLKESQMAKKELAAVQSSPAAGEETAAPDMEQPTCEFAEWIGKPVDEEAVKQTGRPYRVLPPGSMATMDYSPARINLHTDEDGIVIDVRCG